MSYERRRDLITQHPDSDTCRSLTAGPDGIWDLTAQTKARWIFPCLPPDSVNQYYDFHHEFELPDVKEGGVLRISADTDYVAVLNGKYIGMGQYSDYPDQKTYDWYAVEKLLWSGRNTLAVTVFYNGRTSSVYRRGSPGLVFDIQADGYIAGSGTGTRYRKNPCYHSGPIATVSRQLSFTFGYDARQGDMFGSSGYNPGSDWKHIDESESFIPTDRRVLRPRPTAKLVEGELAPACIHSGGYYRRPVSDVLRLDGQAVDLDAAICSDESTRSTEKLRSPAWLMQRDWLSARSVSLLYGIASGTEITSCDDGIRPLTGEMPCPAVASGQAEWVSGMYLVFDLGHQEVGYLEFEIEALAGTMIDIGYGEHLEDLRVRTEVGGRNFASRYICRDGRQHFTHQFLRWAGRYLQLHIDSPNFTLYSLGLRRCEYPLQYRGHICHPNAVVGRIFETGRRTLHLCMHEHYEDSPWREQALYANDARIQALCGYYAFGETVFPAASFALLGRGLRDDGLLELTAPAQPPITIPSFTLIWIMAVRDHLLYSGDDTFARSSLSQIRTMLDRLLDARVGGLLPLRRDKEIWNFYDWSAGMSGYGEEDFERGLTADAPLNCYLLLAIGSRETYADGITQRVEHVSSLVRCVCVGDDRPVCFMVFVAVARHLISLETYISLLHDQYSQTPQTLQDSSSFSRVLPSSITPLQVQSKSTVTVSSTSSS